MKHARGLRSNAVRQPLPQNAAHYIIAESLQGQLTGPHFADQLDRHNVGLAIGKVDHEMWALSIEVNYFAHVSVPGPY